MITLIVSIVALAPKQTSEPAPVDSVKLPIIMYHGLINSRKYQNKFMISPDLFEGDLKYLVDRGYKTIKVKDLIDYVYHDVALPDKPIMITFDDGYYNNYLYAFPLIKKYNCKLVLSPIGKCTDDYSKIHDQNASYAHVTWDNINEMISSGLVEIQNHSYNLHSNKTSRMGCRKLKNESNEKYKKVLTEDLTKMQDRVTEKTGDTPTAFTYPFGAISKESLEIVKALGFKVSFFCEGRKNTITKDPECLYGLCRFIRPNSISSTEYFSKILK